MENCLICRISGGKLPSYKFFEDNQTLAFLDHNPSAPGHTMVIVKRHGETLLDYSAEELKDLFVTVQKVVPALEKTLKCQAMSIGINHREAAGIHHLHIHLIPRFPGDGGEIIQKLVYNKPTEDLGLIAEKIKRNL